MSSMHSGTVQESLELYPAHDLRTIQPTHELYYSINFRWISCLLEKRELSPLGISFHRSDWWEKTWVVWLYWSGYHTVVKWMGWGHVHWSQKDPDSGILEQALVLNQIWWVVSENNSRAAWESHHNTSHLMSLSMKYIITLCSCSMVALGRGCWNQWRRMSV